MYEAPKAGNEARSNSGGGWGVVVGSGGLRHSWALGTRHFRGPQVNPPQDFQVSMSIYIYTA